MPSYIEFCMVDSPSPPFLGPSQKGRESGFIQGINHDWAGDIIAKTHGCVQNDSETHETVLLDCTTGEAGSAIQ